MIQILEATLTDYPTIQNMARFYVYDMSRNCGFISSDWAFPENGLYECFDFKNYFEDPTRKAFLIKVNDELAGFILLNKVGTSANIDWNMGEFFIIAKFQGKGIAQEAAHKIWHMYKGLWEVSVIPENTQALAFWRKSISSLTKGEYAEEIKIIDYDNNQPQRYIFSFNTKELTEALISRANISDITAMVMLSSAKRLEYEKVQPRFWRCAKNANESQTKWFEELITRDDYIVLKAENNGEVIGFVIGQIANAPKVYDPGGLTLIVDDFCVKSPKLWHNVGMQLISELKNLAKTKGNNQILVVCGAHDEPKMQLLKHLNLEIASHWYTGNIV
jgi:predicted acetyltransferase